MAIDPTTQQRLLQQLRGSSVPTAEELALQTIPRQSSEMEEPGMIERIIAKALATGESLKEVFETPVRAGQAVGEAIVGPVGAGHQVGQTVGKAFPGAAMAGLAGGPLIGPPAAVGVGIMGAGAGMANMFSRPTAQAAAPQGQPPGPQQAPPAEKPQMGPQWQGGVSAPTKNELDRAEEANLTGPGYTPETVQKTENFLQQELDPSRVGLDGMRHFAPGIKYSVSGGGQRLPAGSRHSLYRGSVYGNDRQRQAAYKKAGAAPDGSVELPQQTGGFATARTPASELKRLSSEVAIRQAEASLKAYEESEDYPGVTRGAVAGSQLKQAEERAERPSEALLADLLREALRTGQMQPKDAIDAITKYRQGQNPFSIEMPGLGEPEQ
jgi:hypothetical protein